MRGAELLFFSPPLKVGKGFVAFFSFRFNERSKKKKEKMK